MSENKHTKEDLKYLQSLPLQNKIQITQTRIMEWYREFEGQVYVSFSGGKDSTVLLDLTRRVYPNIEAVFVDTGLEYPEIKEFVKTKDNIVWLKPKIRFDEVIKKYGYPVISKDVSNAIYETRNKPDGYASKKFNPESDYCKKYGKRYDLSRWKYLLESDIPISHLCCNIMKKNPVKQYEKENKKYGILGTLACESNLRKVKWLKSGCNAFDLKRPISQPLSFWTEEDILTYLKIIRLPYATIYGDIVQNNSHLTLTGEPRTGCMFCMFGCQCEKEPNKFQRMKITHPKQYDYCIRPVEEHGLGLGSVLDFIGVNY